MHRRVYRNPPVQEAACIFRFEPSSAHDPSLQEKLYPLISNYFVRRESAKHMEVRVTIGQDGPTQDIHILDQTLFVDETGRVQVRVGPNVLAIHHRKPYQGWESFWPAIQLAYRAFCDVEKPKAINSISLRYVNMIEVPAPTSVLDRYFAFYPHLGEALPASPEVFMVAAQSAIPDTQDMLRIHMGNAWADDDHSRVFLDLEVFLAQAPSLPLDNAERWLHNAHNRAVAAFEACIKDSLREQFGLLEG